MWKVYELRTQDSRVYVGCTSQAMSKRMAGHRHRKMPFAMMIPLAVFQTESKEAAHEYEAYLIAKYDSTNPEKGYNRRFGGDNYGFPDYVKSEMLKRLAKGPNSMLGRKHSEETKEKIRQRALARDPSTFENNRHKTPEQIAKLQSGREKYLAEHGAAFRGKHHTEESKAKLSASAMGNQRWLGRKHSEETKRKISKTKRRKREESRV